jgi:hypothetical protein
MAVTAAAVGAPNAPAATASRNRGTPVAIRSGLGTGRNKGGICRSRVLARISTEALATSPGAAAAISEGAEAAVMTAASNLAMAEGPTTGVGRHAASAATDLADPLATATVP